VLAAVGEADSPAQYRAVDAADVVLSALGVPFTRLQITIYSEGADNINAAMSRHGVRRLVVVSSGATEPHHHANGGFLLNRQLQPLVTATIGKTTYTDMRRMEDLVRSSDLEWMIMRPSGIRRARHNYVRAARGSSARHPHQPRRPCGQPVLHHVGRRSRPCNRTQVGVERTRCLRTPVSRAERPARRPNAACGRRTPRPRLVPTLAGGRRPPDGRVFPGYTVSEVLAPCPAWQRPPPPAG
jgi:hypothetical protein